MKSPDTFYDPREGDRFAHKWGYADTRFEFDGPRSVRVTGDRYQISGYSMPYLLPFIESVIQVPLTQDDTIEEHVVYELPDPVDNPGFLDALRSAWSEDQVSTSSKERLTHSHGQLSVDEIYRILTGGSLRRPVDLVVFPENEEEVRALIDLAGTHDVCLVPFGGGTNVSGALLCPEDESRMIVSVDMRRMDRILSIDKENNLATVEAGISGKRLELELAKQGLTTGHDPDSIEFSTLGGWISTNASGMKKNRYGNIEDIVLEATLITPTGTIETHAVTPRNSTGVQPRYLLFGSEGNLGIITKAVLKVHRTPAERAYGSLIFPTFEKGVAYLKELRQTGVMPASIRLVNNVEFRLGQALKPKATGWKAVESRIQKFVLFKVKGFDLAQVAACTILMEGSADEVRQQKRTVFGLAKRHGGISGGAANGRRGYALTFGIGYIRDFVSQFNIVGETFETSVSWNRIHDVCKGVTDELARQLARHKVRGSPYLSYRVTQTYHTGVCIYFTLGFSGNGLERPDLVFDEVEQALRQKILDIGGSLSHHHGIGKIRQRFLPQIQSEASIRVLRETKKAIDPNNTFGIRNGAFEEP